MRARELVNRFNACVVDLRSSPRWGGVVSRRLTVITYVGRKSGQTFSIPVAFRRSGDIVTIGVKMPDMKGWWRNFSGAGGPITVQLDGVDRAGHAVSHRDDKGRVSVTVTLSPAH